VTISKPVGILLLIVLLVAALAVSAMVGSADATAVEVLRALRGSGPETLQQVIWGVRIPRLFLAALVGGALGLSGAVFQALLRNPLAEPYILGISSGGAVGAVGAILFGFAAANSWALPLAAFVGSVGAMVVVLLIGGAVSRRMDPGVLLLAGVVVGAFLSAIILLLLTFAELTSFRSAMFWLMGSLNLADWKSVTVLGIYFVPSALLLCSMARALDLLAIGEETALFMGVRVERTKKVAYLATSLLVGAAVAVSGVIGFVGLIVPHALRMIWGNSHRFLLPASVLAGATFLLFTDLVARTAVPSVELPTGVVTALIGVPIFLVILIRSRR